MVYRSRGYNTFNENFQLQVGENLKNIWSNSKCKLQIFMYPIVRVSVKFYQNSSNSQR